MSEKIIFSDLVDKIAEETGVSKRLIHDLLIETKNVTSQGLERDGRINISELGHFDLKWHEARPGRNPQTGEEIEIPAHNTINFKATSDLREYINRKYAHLKSDFIEEDEPGITAVPPISPEPEPLKPEPAPEYSPAPSEEEDKSKRSYAWLWLIIPIIIIILAYLFYPSKKAAEAIVEEPTQTETFVEDIKSETEESQKPVEETAAVEEESAPVKSKIGTPGGTYSVQPGDNLWTIARDYYKQAYLWPNIYRVNLNEIKNPDMLSIGNDVPIPSLQGKPGSLTKKDINEIAEGFVEVYLVYKKMGKEKAQYYLWVVNKWEEQEVIEKFKDQIDEEDLKIIGKIEGEPVIR